MIFHDSMHHTYFIQYISWPNHFWLRITLNTFFKLIFIKYKSVSVWMSTTCMKASWIHPFFSQKWQCAAQQLLDFILCHLYKPRAGLKVRSVLLQFGVVHVHCEELWKEKYNMCSIMKNKFMSWSDNQFAFSSVVDIEPGATLQKHWNCSVTRKTTVTFTVTYSKYYI